MKVHTKRLLLESIRRYFLSPNKHRLDSMYMGLGTPSVYRQGVQDGYFIPESKETPRIIGWYYLTEKGKDQVRTWIEDLGINQSDFDGFDFVKWHKFRKD